MSKRGHGSIMFNLRLAPEEKRTSTKEERKDALEYLIDHGKVPKGWKMAAIKWMNPARASKGWVHGGEEDLDKFLPILREIGLENLRMHPVETGVSLSPKKERKLRSKESQISKLIGRLTRERDRRKSKGARAPYDSELKGLRKKRGLIVEALRGEEEYEVAIDYRPRR